MSNPFANAVRSGGITQHEARFTWLLLGFTWPHGTEWEKMVSKRVYGKLFTKVSPRLPPTCAQLYNCSNRSLSRSEVPMAAICWLLTRDSSSSQAGWRWANVRPSPSGSTVGAMMTESSWDTAKVWQPRYERPEYFKSEVLLKFNTHPTC